MNVDTSKPNWSDAPPWANFLALDGGGNWWWFENEPWFEAEPINEWTATGKAEVGKNFDLYKTLECKTNAMQTERKSTPSSNPIVPNGSKNCLFNSTMSTLLVVVVAIFIFLFFVAFYSTK